MDCILQWFQVMVLDCTATVLYAMYLLQCTQYISVVIFKNHEWRVKTFCAITVLAPFEVSTCHMNDISFQLVDRYIAMLRKCDMFTVFLWHVAVLYLVVLPCTVLFIKLQEAVFTVRLDKIAIKFLCSYTILYSSSMSCIPCCYALYSVKLHLF